MASAPCLCSGYGMVAAASDCDDDRAIASPSAVEVDDGCGWLVSLCWKYDCVNRIVCVAGVEADAEADSDADSDAEVAWCDDCSGVGSGAGSGSGSRCFCGLAYNGSADAS